MIYVYFMLLRRELFIFYIPHIAGEVDSKYCPLNTVNINISQHSSTGNTAGNQLTNSNNIKILIYVNCEL
jgi:hypothetical protein